MDTYLQQVSGKSNSVARAVAAEILGENLYWDWDGLWSLFCRMINSKSVSIKLLVHEKVTTISLVESRHAISSAFRAHLETILFQAAIKRTKAFAPYADLLWLETKSPDLKQAKYFSGKIKEDHPHK